MRVLAGLQQASVVHRVDVVRSVGEHQHSQWNASEFQRRTPLGIHVEVGVWEDGGGEHGSDGHDARALQSPRRS